MIHTVLGNIVSHNSQEICKICTRIMLLAPMHEILWIKIENSRQITSYIFFMPQHIYSNRQSSVGYLLYSLFFVCTKWLLISLKLNSSNVCMICHFQFWGMSYILLNTFDNRRSEKSWTADTMNSALGTKIMYSVRLTGHRFLVPLSTFVIV